VGILQNFIQAKKICYRLGFILFIAGLLVYAYPMFFFRFTKETPKVNHLCYGLDWDSGKAWWMTRDKELDEWTEQFFKKGVEFKKPEPFVNDNIIVRFGEAPVATYPQPLLTVLEDKTENEVRHLKVALVSLRKSPEVRVTLSGELQILSAKVNGIAFDNSDGKTIPNWKFNYRGYPDEKGLVFEWELKHKQPLNLEVIEKSYVIPPIPGIEIPLRPEYMFAEPNTVEWWKPFRSNAIYTRKTFALN